MDASPEIHATKLQAAKRQLDAGVRMFFGKEDSLAVHTVAFAAYGLLFDLAEAVGSTTTVKRMEEDAHLRNGTEFWSDLKNLANFIKHAKRDPGGVIAGIPEEINEATLLIDCFLLREIDQLSSPESQALWLWHHAIYFIDIVDAPSEYWSWVEEFWSRLHSDNREEKIKIGTVLLDRLVKGARRDYRMEAEKVLLPWRLVIRPTIGTKF